MTTKNKPKKFTDWTPTPGEYAIVPGGPKCKPYLSKLTQADCDAINSGHKGYTPRTIYIIDNRSGKLLERLYWLSREWGNTKAGGSSSLGYIRQSVSRYHQVPLEYVVIRATYSSDKPNL